MTSRSLLGYSNGNKHALAQAYADDLPRLNGKATHNEHGYERSLQQSHQHVTPVVFEVRHACVSHVQREGHQEELDGWSDQSRPLPLHPGLDVKLNTTEPISRVHASGIIISAGWLFSFVIVLKCCVLIGAFSREPYKLPREFIWMK